MKKNILLTYCFMPCVLACLLISLPKASGADQPNILVIWGDDIGIWNRALDSCEIVNLYNASLGCGCSPTTATDTQSACDSYTWIDGNTYTSNNNTATYTFTNDAVFDFGVHVDLTFKSETLDAGNAKRVWLGFADIRVDGERVQLVDAAFSNLEAEQGTRLYEIPVTLEAGEHEIAAGFLTEYFFPETSLEGNLNSAFNYSVDYVLVGGPYITTRVGMRESQQRIFICRPEHSDEEVSCARRILTSLARRAYRGLVTVNDIDPLITLFSEGRIENICEIIKKNGNAYEKDGALWLESSKYGDDKDRVVIRDDLSLIHI